ncbi:MAG: tetratricopeptide repeat protein [candidate division WOR-3 bacterium]|nr:MAG: tetratricopeptide repeat protein [candidate division WOR-3 bacterium]
MAIITFSRILISIVIFSNSSTSYELFSIGSQLELDGNVKEAVVYYKKALEIDPGAAEVYRALVNALYKIRKFDEGIQFASEGLSLFPADVEFLKVLALGYIGKGDIRRAVEIYEKVLPLESENIDVYTTLSILYEGTDQLTKAREVLEDMPVDLKTTDVFTRLGTLSGKENNHESAIRYYHEAYTLDTTNTTALIGIGTGFDILGQEDSAIYYYETVLRTDTLNISVGKRLIDLYSDVEQYEKLITLAGAMLQRDFFDGYVRRTLGFAFYKLGLKKQALNEFLIASQIDPRDTYSRFYVGRIYLEQGNYEAAQNEIMKAIGTNPDFIELWVYLGFIAIDREDFETAEYAFTEAAHRGADVIQIYYLLGVVLEMKQQHLDAYSFYHKSVDEDPDNLASLEALANLCERIDKKDEAFETFQRIVELDTANAVALNYVGYTYAERNENLDYALELVNKALTIEENNGYYIDSRGWVYYQMGRYEDALKDLKRAADLTPDAVILEHLGDVYMKLDNLDEARATYERALEQDPENEVLKKKLQDINQ